MIRKAAGDQLESIQLFDVFTGDQLGEGKKSLAFSVVFRSADKTFDSQDSVTVRKAVTDAAAELGAQLRA